MATKLPSGKRLKREMILDEVDLCPVQVTLSTEGIVVRVPGHQLGVFLPWRRFFKNAETPLTVPAHLFGDSLRFLQHQAAKKQK